RHRAGVRARLPGAADRRDQPPGAHAVRLSPDPGAGAPLRRAVAGTPAPAGAPGDPRAQGGRGVPGMAAPAARPDLRRAVPGGAIRRPVVALTSGEPAGVGPELCARAARESFAAKLVVIGDRSLLPGAEVQHVPLRRPCVPGKLDPGNSRYVLEVLDRAIDGCLAGEYDAMVTAPVQKSVINDAGIIFTGHTEYLAERSRSPHVVMMLVGGGLRVALATTHLPLSAVPGAIRREDLVHTLRVIDADLKKRFRIARPRILVAGLNPHSGESGHF